MTLKTTRSATVTYVRAVVIIAVFSALAAAGGLVKLPSPVGSIALDSAPGFFVAGFFSPLLGGLTGLAGHFASAGIAGFPLAVAHIPIAIMQFVWCFIFGWILRKGKTIQALVIASIVAIVANGVLAPLALAGLFPDYKSLLGGLIPFLLLASAINVVMAAIAVKSLARLDIPGL